MAASNKLLVNATSAVVTLDVFSGRPNPEWTLTPAMAADLSSRLGTLEATNETPKPFDGLGYRGMRVELHEQAGTTAVLNISHGYATLDQGGQHSRYSDPGRQLESWLTNTGSEHLSADVLRYVMDEIAKSQ